MEPIPPPTSWYDRLGEQLRRLPGDPVWWLAGAGALLLIVGFVVGLVLGGDGDPDDDIGAPTSLTTLATSTTTTIGDGDTTTTTSEAPSEPVDANPLTGVELPEPLARQVVAVKVGNAPNEQPQIGLDVAEMLIEVPVEGGLTRLTALYFANDPPVVGPVRSLRPVDPDLLGPFEPLLVSTGGRPFVLREVEAATIDGFDTTLPELFRVLERDPPGNLAVDMRLVNQLRSGRTPEGVFEFGPGFAGALPADTVVIPFSGATTVEWKFDGQRYARIENGEPFLVLPDVGGEATQLVVDTVIVMTVAQRSAGYTDTAGTDVPTFDVIGFGEVTLAHGGMAMQGEWRRGALEDGFQLVDNNGFPLLVPPGTTAVAFVPRSIEIELR